MALPFPPATLTGRPVRYTLSAGSSLHRIHHSGTPAHDFDTPRSSIAPGGGRFDSSGEHGYPFLYASPTETTALVERFLRNMAPSPDGSRVLLRKSLNSQSLSVLQTTTDLTLLSMSCATDLAAIHADHELLTATGPDHEMVCVWATWLRGQVDWAQGFVWQSNLDFPQQTMVLFGDRCPNGAVKTVEGLTERLDSVDRHARLRHQLGPYHVQLNPPEPDHPPKVFINYRSGDGGAAALALDAETSERMGEASVFRDNRSIPPGSTFQDELLCKVRQCKVLLVVIGKDWENITNSQRQPRLHDPADWVRTEIREAGIHHVTVVPILVGARPPLNDADLPEDIRWLAERQFLHLPNDFDVNDVSRVVDRLLERVPEFAV